MPRPFSRGHTCWPDKLIKVPATLLQLDVIFCQTNTWTSPLLLNNVTKHFRHFVKLCPVNNLLRLLFVRLRYQCSGLANDTTKIGFFLICQIQKSVCKVR